MSRPIKPAAEKREQRFNLRLTFGELIELQENADRAGLAPHEYARKRILGHRVAAPKSPIEARLMSELNRVGVNLNQLTRSINSGADTNDTAAELLENLGRILDQIGASLDS